MLEMSTTKMGLLFGAIAATAVALWLLIGRISSNHKMVLKNSVDHVFALFERFQVITPLTTFSRDYDSDYTGLKALEENYDIIRRECETLLKEKESLPDTEKLGGDYTAGGVHAIKWKSFVLKWGDFIDENCQRCPETKRLLSGIPKVTNALFSVLEPRQYIKPHCGYYKGYLRYHLGVVIPNNNDDQKCYIRLSPLNWINSQPKSYDEGARQLSENSSTYYWRNGEGVLFDDTRLHDAENSSDEVRVILILDIRRKMPLLLDLFNRFFLLIAYADGFTKTIKANAIPSK